MTRNSLENRDARLTVRLLDDEARRDPAPLVVIGADEAQHLRARLLRRGRIELGVHDDHRNPGAIGFHDRRHDLPGPAGRQTQRLDIGLEQVFDDLHLAFDIVRQLAIIQNHSIRSFVLHIWRKNSHIAGDVPGHKSRLRFVTQPVQFCNNLIHKLMIVHFGLKDPTELPSMIGTEER